MIRLEKLNKLNQYFSFNLIAFAGWIILFSKIYLSISYNHDLHLYDQGSWIATYGWLQLFFFAIYCSIFIIAFIIFLFEKMFHFKIHNKFFLENKFLKITFYLGFAITLIYCVVNLFSFLHSILSQCLFPSELIYFID